MAIEARLEKLNERHQNLEISLSEELSHTATDDLRIHDIKRQKLKIKDEMEKLRSMSLEHK